MSQDDSGSDHFSDYYSEASDDDGNNPETETTEVATRRPKNLTKEQIAAKRKKTYQLHTKFVKADKPVPIRPLDVVKMEWQNNKHPFQRIRRNQTWCYNEWPEGERVSKYKLEAAYKEYQNLKNKGRPSYSKSSTGTGDLSLGYNGNDRINGRCSVDGCPHIANGYPEFTFDDDESNEPSNHHWRVGEFVEHTCSRIAKSSKGVSNCAYKSYELAFTIQNNTGVLEKKSNATIRAACQIYTVVVLTSSFLQDIKVHLINLHEGLLQENMRKIPELVRRIEARGHHVSLQVIDGEKLKVIAIRNAKVAWYGQNRKKLPKDKEEFDKERVEVDDIKEEWDYLVGATVAHKGFLEMRRNGCNRVFSSDACHMQGLVKGTCFSTTSQNANGNLVPLYVSYNIEAEGRKPWLLSQKNLELFDPSINELPSELLTRPLNVLIVINTEFHILCILQHIFLFHLFFLFFFFSLFFFVFFLFFLIFFLMFLLFFHCFPYCFSITLHVFYFYF